MNKSVLKRLAAALPAAFLGLALTLSGCGPASAGLVERLSSSGMQTVKAPIPDDRLKENKDKIFRGLAGWPKPPLYQGNPFGAGGIGDTNNRYLFEGMFVFIRSMNNVYNVLAESVEEKGDATIVHLHKNVKWHDGAPFTSKDIWGYYRLNNGAEVTKYLNGIDTPDDYTVVFHWANPAPYPELKRLFLAQDLQGQIAYHLYKRYVDEADRLLNKATPLTDPAKQAPFHLEISDELKKGLDKNWQEFIRSGPDKPIGTGPYKFDRVTTTDMLLVKNPDYWQPNSVHFDKIWLKNVPELSAQYALVKSGKLEFYDGTPPKDIMESLLASNKDLLHYRMFDPASVGMLYNIRRKPFDNLKFRQALTYVLDKRKLREIGNYYGKEYPNISMTGIMPSSLQQELSPETASKMTDYTQNLRKAEELLTEIGWTKGQDGNWRDPQGRTPSFIIGAASGWVPAVNSGQIAAEQLTRFGIPTKLKAVDGSIYYANADKGMYDMSIDWVDVSWGFQNAWNSMRVVYWQGSKTKIGFPNIKEKDANGNEVDTGNLDLKIRGMDGKIVDVDQEMKRYPFVQDEKERSRIINNLAWIANENCWGVNYFQNVTGAWLNTKTMDGRFPMSGDIVKYDRDMPLPDNQEDMLNIAYLNHGFNSTRMPFDYWPK